MKAILGEYVEALKERDELDVLLPKLLSEMDINPISTIQKGVRQFGVDVPAVGIDPDDGKRKLFAFVIKRGDIGRGKDWTGETNSVKPSIEEAFELYFTKMVPEEHKHLDKKVVLVTSGLLKQELTVDWAALTERFKTQGQLSLWNSHELVSYLQRFMLNETIFSKKDGEKLRKALALAGDVDYQRAELHSLLYEKLGFTEEFSSTTKMTPQQARIGAVQANLFTRMFASRALDADNLKQALFASERNILWQQHRKLIEANGTTVKQLDKQCLEASNIYHEQAKAYTKFLKPYSSIRNGLSVCANFGSLFSVLLFEQIGILASIGLMQQASPDAQCSNEASATLDILQSLIENHTGCGSPRLDENVIDVDLALSFLIKMGREKVAEEWLASLTERLIGTFAAKQFFPVLSIDELLQKNTPPLSVPQGYSYISRILAHLAAWTVVLDRNDLYELFAISQQKAFFWVHVHSWHPETKDYDKFLAQPLNATGVIESRIDFPMDRDAYAKRRRANFSRPQFEIPPKISASQPYLLLACRHFRTMPPPLLLFCEQSSPVPSDFESN
jgi:hypothetical protein